MHGSVSVEIVVMELKTKSSYSLKLPPIPRSIPLAIKYEHELIDNDDGYLKHPRREADEQVRPTHSHLPTSATQESTPSASFGAEQLRGGGRHYGTNATNTNYCDRDGRNNDVYNITNEGSGYNLRNRTQEQQNPATRLRWRPPAPKTKRGGRRSKQEELIPQSTGLVHMRSSMVQALLAPGNLALEEVWKENSIGGPKEDNSSGDITVSK